MRHQRPTGLFWVTLLGLLLAGGTAPGELLAQAVEEREAANEEGTAAQRQVDELADDTEALLSNYRSALRQIESTQVYNAQMSELIAAQEEEMLSLQDQIDKIELVGRGVTPLMFRMIDSLEQFVSLDVPFLMGERSKRVAELRELMDRSDVSESEKYRRITEAYQIENEFGRTIEAYSGILDVDGRQVDFLRVGRIALVYLTPDGGEAGAWNQQERRWEVLPASYRSGIEQGLRIARKQAAPDMIRLPIAAPVPAGGES